MPKLLAAALEAARQSLWLIPAIAVVLAVVAAELLVWLSGFVMPGWLPLVFGGGPSGAQALLQAIAGSVITVAGVTFSVTILVLQLTSTQFSPRVLRNFMRDRISQSVLAVFLATFIYALFVLGSVRSEGGSGEPQALPILAIAGALVLTLVSIGMLAYFIHHIAHTIQVSTITDSVSRETRATLRRHWTSGSTDSRAQAKPAPMGEEAVLPARESGYLAYAAYDRLVALATEADATLRLHLAPGEWVSEGRPLISVAPPAARDRLSDDPRDEVDLGPQPTLQQDVAFGIRQLVDVALKALSPSLNDPSTAVNCIHRLSDLLLEAGRRNEPMTVRADESGAPRLIAPQHDFADLTGLAFDQLRHFGGERLYVALAMADALATLREDLPAHRHAPILRQARLLATAARGIEPDEDQQTVLDAIDRAVRGGG